MSSNQEQNSYSNLNNNSNLGATDSGFANPIPNMNINNSGFESSHQTALNSNSNSHPNSNQQQNFSQSNQGTPYCSANPMNNNQANNQFVSGHQNMGYSSLSTNTSNTGQFSHNSGGQPNNALHSGQFTQNTDGKLLGVPGCVKCNGTGFKKSKKSDGKIKNCKSCMKKSGSCSKCNGTGLKIKDGKACKCKTKKK